MFHLNYAIRTAPVPDDVLPWILRAQTRMNDAIEWSNDELNFALVDGKTVRDTQSFPFVYTARGELDEVTAQTLLENGDHGRIPRATAVGETEVRTLWDFHLIAAFLRVASERFPEILFSLSDESCLLLPVGAIRIQSGKMSPYTNWLCSEYEFIVNMSSDEEEGVVERACAQLKALKDGQCTTDMPAAHGVLRQMNEIGLDERDYQGLSVGEVALKYVRRLLAEML